MTTSVQSIPVVTHVPAKPLFQAPLPWLVGFFFSFRLAITYLAFQADPRIGTIVLLVGSALLLSAAIMCAIGEEKFSLKSFASNRTLRWVFVYLALSGVSLFWTAAESILDAGGLWSGMLMETAIVLLLLGQAKAEIANRADAIFKGFTIGMLLVGAVAWMAPTLPDLRIGDYEFLHPNMIGMNSALAFLLAQYLALRQPSWKWACLALALTLLRSISKTSIIALCLAEVFYLVRETTLTRKRKVQIALTALAVFAFFASLLSTYIENYTNTGTGSQLDTLTGRTTVWAIAFSMAIEKPWMGHGFYSLRALMPPLDSGNFEPWHAHNELLQEFFEYGALGIVVTIGAYRSLLSAARRSAKRISASLQDSLHPYHKLVFVALLFTVIHGLTESMNFGLTIPLWLFATLAIAMEQTPEATFS